MIDLDLLFEDKCGHVNISKSEQYMLITKSKKAVLYDFQKKEKICDINLQYVMTSMFTPDERFIVLQKPYSFGIFDIDTKSVICMLRTGRSNVTQVVLSKMTLFYVYTHKDHSESVLSYDIITKKKTVLYKKSNVFIPQISVHHDNLLIFYHEIESTIMQFALVDICTRESKDISTDFSSDGIAYADYTQCAYTIKWQPHERKTMEIYSVDIDSGEITKFLNIPHCRLSIQIKAQGKHLYVTRLVATRIIDLEDGDEYEIALFPAAFVNLCDNDRYFGVFNGEYFSLYKYK